MNEEQFERERRYQTSLAVAKTMKEKSVITAEEYSAIDTILREKYRPLLGSLQSVNMAETLDM